MIEGNKNELLVMLVNFKKFLVLLGNNVVKGSSLSSQGTFTSGGGTSRVLDGSSVSTEESSVKGVKTDSSVGNIDSVDGAGGSGWLVSDSNLGNVFSLGNGGEDSIDAGKLGGSNGISRNKLNELLVSVGSAGSGSSGGGGQLQIDGGASWCTYSKKRKK